MAQHDEPAFEEAGLYDPAAPDAAERLALLEHLHERGVTIEEMVAAGEFTPYLASLAADRILLDIGQVLSAEQVAERTGSSVERVQRVRLACGLPAEEGQQLPSWIPEDISGFEMASTVFGESATLAFTRVMGASAARIAEAAIGLFLSEIDTELNARGASGVEWAQANEEAASLVGVVTTLMTHLLREHLILAIRRQRPASLTNESVGNVLPMSIGFVDLTSSTEWATSLPLREQADALSLFEKSAWEIATKRGGRIVKLIGDEAMFAAPDPVDACEIALELCAAVSEERLLPEARGAVGFGDVVTRDGDYYGPLVHIIARSVKLAGESGVVVDSAVATRCRAAGALIEFTELGPQSLRGIEEPVPLFSATRPHVPAEHGRAS
jgi:adenylate cyclase